MRQSWICALAVGLAATGCGNDLAGQLGPFDLIVATDKSEYSLTADSVARVTLSNRSDRLVYLPMASYLECERLRDGEWRDAFAWFVVDGIGRSFSLAPGAAVTDELQLRFYLPHQPGTYRFRYLVYADPAVRSLLPIEERVSEPVVVER
jgi:hypothetical protein